MLIQPSHELIKASTLVLQSLEGGFRLLLCALEVVQVQTI
jgi:hypothetical protein